MAKTDAKGRSKGDFKHVRLQEWLLRSDAYRSLSCTARCLLVELYRKYNGTNNGDLFLSCRDAAELLGLSSKDTASRAFRELQVRGFILAKGRGAFSMKLKLATTWILTEFPVGEELPTKEFMRFKAPDQKQNTVRPIGRTVRPIGPVSLKSDREHAPRSDPSDREGQNEGVHGPIIGTQLSYHADGGREGGEQQQQQPAARPHAARFALAGRRMLGAKS